MSWGAGATVARLVVAPLFAAAAGVVYFQYRITRLPVLAWLALAMTIFGVGSIGVAMVRLSNPDGFAGAGWLILLDLNIAMVIATIAWLSRTRTCRVDPLAAGLVLGLVASCGYLMLSETSPAAPAWLPPAAGFLALALWALAAARLMRRDSPLPRWFTHRIGIGFLAMVLGRVITATMQTSTPVVAIAVVVLTTAGGVLVLSASLAALRIEIQHQEEWLEALGTQLAQLEEQQVDERSRLHEITNTVAGIACASNLIHSNRQLSAQYRERLEEMLDRESARLARILAGRAAHDQSDGAAAPATAAPGPTTATGAAAGSATEPVDLDGLIRPLVSAQQAIGREVEWQPSGLRVAGDADSITEALNILLDNSRKHAPGATTTVVAREADGAAEVVVADDGPGIAPDRRTAVFTWGERGETSRGQGLGLSLARTRLEHTGGTLDLAPSRVGARFVVRLPRHDRDGAPSDGIRDRRASGVPGASQQRPSYLEGDTDDHGGVPVLASHGRSTLEEAS
ncbi:HAMP domain-containing sensor histidine kinase [Nocardioides sp. YIM 152588]|uniref:sensor histidine kinase n=1 Tax=Nocardioides sp. YIM 152588 TaxID=3158259 RepID=UPI0032E50104